MKKKILSKLAKIADKLDDLKYHEEASVITTIFLRVAQMNDWDLPEGAQNDPNAPWNQDDSGYEEAYEKVDREISNVFVPAFKQYYTQLLKLLHHALIHTGNDKDRAIQDLFNVDPYYKQSEIAYLEFHKKMQETFGKIGDTIAESAAQNFLQFAQQHGSESEIAQVAQQTVQPHIQAIYDAKLEDISNFDYED
jgi:hypothetical protein